MIDIIKNRATINDVAVTRVPGPLEHLACVQRFCSFRRQGELLICELLRGILGRDGPERLVCRWER
jgi:hypothetical protein